MKLNIFRQPDNFCVVLVWAWIRYACIRPKYADKRRRQQAVIDGIANQVQHGGKTNVITQISLFQA